MNNPESKIIIQCVGCGETNGITPAPRICNGVISHWECGNCKKINHSMISINPVDFVPATDDTIRRSMELINDLPPITQSDVDDLLIDLHFSEDVEDIW